MTSEERDDMKRHFGVLVEGLRSEIQQVAEGVSGNTEALERSRAETAHGLAAVRGEMSVGFTAVGRELKAVHIETAAMRSGADAFRVETARNFADLRAEIRSSHKDVDRRLKTVEARHAPRR